MNRHDKSHRRPQVAPQRIALAAALAAALTPFGAAQAQTTGSTSASADNTVVVTGVRRAIETAQTIKQESEQVVDSIVADDIGKFPDKNVAEILGRVTGVQMVREGGEAGAVIVRGLGGIVTLLNGREMFTAVGRSLYLADVPTTVLRQIDVYKTQGPDTVEGGTAGVIDVRTNRPFDFKGREVSLALKNEYRDKAKSNNPDVAGLFSNRWQTPLGEVGVLLGSSYQRGKYHDETGWVSPPIPVQRSPHTVDGVANGSGTVTGFDAMGRVQANGDRKRNTNNFAVQWRPRKDVEVLLEGFHTLVKHDAESDFFVGALPWGNSGATITTDGAGSITKLTHPSADNFTLSSTQARRDYSRGEQYAAGVRWDITPSLRGTTEFVHTNSNWKRSNPIMDLTWFAPKAVEATVVNGGGFLNYPGGGITNPANFRIFAFFDNHAHDESHANDWRGDLTWAVDKGWLKDLAAGVRINERVAQHVNNVDGFTSTPDALRVPVSTVPGLACLSADTGGRYGFSQFVTPCRNFLLDNIGEARRLATGSSVAKPDDPLSFYKVVERTQALYLKGGFGFKLGNIPVDGTGGVRLVRTEQTLTGYGTVGNVVSTTPFTTDSSHTDVLPSLSLKATWQPGLISRLVFGKAIQRPNFADFNPGLRLFPSNGNTTLSVGNAGNPNLKPIESTNVDATLEWYFAPASSLTATVFHHAFDNFLVFSAAPEVYNGVSYMVTRPYNAQSGKLKGLELGYRQFFDKLPGVFSGLGLEANYTLMRGGLTDAAFGTTPDFPGMSKTAYNLVGLYEKNGWYARLAYNWRSKFTAEYNYRATGTNLIVDPLRWLDGSVGYRFNDKLSIGLDANNLLNQDYHDYHSEPKHPRDVRRYDRTVGLSLRMKL